MRKGLVLSILVSSFAFASEPKVSLVYRVFKPGEIFAVVATTELAPSKLEGDFLGRPLHFFQGKPGTVIALAGIDLEDPLGKTTLTIDSVKEAEPSLHWKQEIEVLPKKFVEQHLKTEKKYTEPTPEEVARATKEREELTEVFAAVTDERFLDGNFRKPLNLPHSNKFGSRRFFNKEPKDPHSGEDFPAKMGYRVRATQRGKVALIGDHFYNGNIIVLDHGYGLTTNYLHLSKIKVNVGDIVERGQVIGLVGNTGRTSVTDPVEKAKGAGSHLHWGVRLNKVRINPLGLTSLDLKPYLPAEIVQTSR
jgi:murein DD-endopeptidase MepM/ murein hydrolase activator NlpD